MSASTFCAGTSLNNGNIWDIIYHNTCLGRILESHLLRLYAPSHPNGSRHGNRAVRRKKKKNFPTGQELLSSLAIQTSSLPHGFSKTISNPLLCAGTYLITLVCTGPMPSASPSAGHLDGARQYQASRSLSLHCSSRAIRMQRQKRAE